jgi:nucleoside-diphosphate-sugar epimerase
MHVFVTGASGHIGSPVVEELLSAGHRVTGLARSDAAAAALDTAGAKPLRGSLDDLELLGDAARAADGVIHLAFKHDAMMSGGYVAALEADRRAIDAMGEALAHSGKPFVGTSGTLVLAGLNRIGTEDDAIESGPRVDAENAVMALAGKGVRSSVIRLPPSVHSSLDLHGFVPMLIGIARECGVAAYVGEGTNRWPAGHTLDAARLYRLALESAPAGSRLHGNHDEGVPFRAIAEAIGRNLGIPTKSIVQEEAAGHFGFLGALVMLDNPTSSERTQTLLDWHPDHPRLIEDLDDGHYFREASISRADLR